MNTINNNKSSCGIPIDTMDESSSTEKIISSPSKDAAAIIGTNSSSVSPPPPPPSAKDNNEEGIKGQHKHPTSNTDNIEPSSKNTVNPSKTRIITEVVIDNPKEGFMERVAARRRRNEERLIDLGLKKRNTTTTTETTRRSSSSAAATGDETTNANNTKKRRRDNCGGMVFRTEYNRGCLSDDDENDDKDDNDEEEGEIEATYPHRSPQIRLLRGIFSASARQARSTGDSTDAVPEGGSSTGRWAGRPRVYVPPPVFITGSSGSGKTAIVRRVLRQVRYQRYDDDGGGEDGVTESSRRRRRRRRRRVGVAYIDCSTLETGSTGRFLEDAFDQLQRDFNRGHGCGAAVGDASVDPIEEDVARVINMVGQKKEDNDGQHDQEDEEEEWMERQRKKGERYSTGEAWKRKKLRQAKPKHSTAAQPLPNQPPSLGSKEQQPPSRRITRSNTATHIPQSSSTPDATANTINSPHLNNDATATETSATASSFSSSRRSSSFFQTPMAFGRALSRFCGVSNYGSRVYGGSAFFVIDHADRLLSLRTTDDGDNFMSQLLLMPKVMQLNLTVVIITTHVLLDFTRVNSVQGLESVGYISDAVHPFRCHFHAYKGHTVFSDILTTPKLTQCVTGTTPQQIHDSCKLNTTTKSTLSATTINTFISTLHKSLVEIVIQSVENTTRDIREMQRLLRLLWPLYLEPISVVDVDDCKPSSQQSLSSATTNAGGDHLLKEYAQTLMSNDSERQRRLLEDKTKMGQLLGKLGGLVRSHVVKVSTTNVLRPTQGGYYRNTPGSVSDTNAAKLSFSKRLPYLTKFVLLAAYLCQKNKAAQDQMLHTGKKSGKRKKKRPGTGAENNASELIAYASSVKATKEIRVTRVPSFPLERMLSVFSSICTKYGKGSMLILTLGGDEVRNDDSFRNQMADGAMIDVRRLGSVSFFESVTQLLELGFLEDVRSASSSANPNAQKRYKCNLSTDQAQDICNLLGFPLEQYIVGQ